MKLFLTVTLCFFIQICVATTFYISPAGSDQSGNGSSSNPWRSLFKATSAVTEPGSVIHVMAGTYIETQQSSLAVGVSIEGEGTNSILKSSLSADWTEMLSLKSATEGTNGNQHISNLKFDGQNLTAFWGIYVGGRSNVSIHDILIIDFKDEGVIITGRTDNTESAPSIYATGNTFYNNTVLNCARYADNWGRGCLNIGGQSGMLIYNNTITQTGRKKGTNGWPIKYANGGFLKGVKIYNNIIIKEAFDGFTWDFAIELFNESGLEIYNNKITGSIDLNHQNKGDYPFSVYIHDNIIGPKIIQPQLEDGIILEFESNDIIIEKNQLNNLGVIVYFTPRKGDIIKNISINNNFCNNIGVAGGKHSGFAIRMGQEEDDVYFLENLFIKGNEFIASSFERPYWGIGILGVTKANNVIIQNNIIKNFSAGCIVANPANTIDTIIINNNNLYGNGWNNIPVFSKGIPFHYSFKKNVRANGSLLSFINIKMNFIRPLYYELKSTNLLEFFAIIACIWGLWFSKNENKYVFPMMSLGIFYFMVMSIAEGWMTEACICLSLILINVYGWILWNKRDKKNHRIVRTSFSSNKEKIVQVIFFVTTFVLINIICYLLQNDFLPDFINLTENFVFATVITGLWSTTKKKVENWYWLIVGNLSALSLCFIKHYLLTCIYFSIFLFCSFLGLYKWKKLQKK